MTTTEMLQKLADIDGFDSVLAMLESATFDGVASSICRNCVEYTIELEPDACDCECCEVCEDGGRVSSCLVIAGLI